MNRSVNNWFSGRFLEATDRLPVRTVVVVRRIDVAIVVEVEVIRVVAIRSNRPIVAVVAGTVQPSIVVVTITRSGR